MASYLCDAPCLPAASPQLSHQWCCYSSHHFQLFHEEYLPWHWGCLAMHLFFFFLLSIKITFWGRKVITPVVKCLKLFPLLWEDFWEVLSVAFIILLYCRNCRRSLQWSWELGWEGCPLAADIASQHCSERLENSNILCGKPSKIRYWLIKICNDLRWHSFPICLRNIKIMVLSFVKLWSSISVISPGFRHL